jgi:hypothetical protein
MNETREHPIRPIRRAGVPLAGFESTDPALTIAGAIKALNGKQETTPLLQWDCIRGLVGLNDAGIRQATKIGAEPITTQNPTECLTKLSEIGEDSIVFFHNAQLYLADATVKQAIWNLRDIFKSRHATLILLGTGLRLPAELGSDVVLITEALPDVAEIKRIIGSIIQDAELQPLNEETTSKASDALLGLSAFAAEQCLAMSLSKAGVDLGSLWERKRKSIEQTPGLSCWRGGESFADIGGCENVKAFMRDIARGRKAPRAIAFIDEIEKALSGTAGDLSGVSQDYLGALLTFMQDKASTGVIFIGPPGAAKSAIAKATGNESGIPTIQVDLGAMKGSLVGQSEQQLRNALNVIDAVSQGQTLFIATCNSFANLPPELKRRFTLGTFFFDLPTAEERAAIWAIYCRKLDLSGACPPDDGWTGAEIKQCCEIAWRLNRPLCEAARFIVPVSVSAADKIDLLRKQADGKFISASGSGLYRVARPAETGRKFARD